MKEEPILQMGTEKMIPRYLHNKLSTIIFQREVKGEVDSCVIDIAD
jgi:hypothetical protein